MKPILTEFMIVVVVFLAVMAAECLAFRGTRRYREMDEKYGRPHFLVGYWRYLTARTPHTGRSLFRGPPK